MQFFQSAKMIFSNDLKQSASRQMAFRRDFELNSMPKKLILTITGRTFFKLYLNGEFVFYGPARAPHQVARVDSFDILPWVRLGNNALAIELCTYAKTDLLLYVTGEYGFIQAELVADEKVIIATDSSWQYDFLPQRDWYVEQFSHARGPSEVYRLDADYYTWRTAGLPNAKQAVAFADAELRYLARNLALPDLSVCTTISYTGAHAIRKKTSKNAINEYPMMAFSPVIDPSMPPMVRPVLECQNDSLLPFEGTVRAVGPSGYSISSNCDSWAVDFDFETVHSGFIGIDFETPSQVTVDLIIVNRLNEAGEMEPRTCHTNTVIRLSAPAGRWQFEAFEVTDIRYVRIIIRGSFSLEIQKIFLRHYRAQSCAGGYFSCSDNDFNRIYKAACLNLRLNAIDGFLDCPGRERGNWATDSFWTARAARLFFGDASIERVHLENFLDPSLKKRFKTCFPACYPGDHTCHIQNWTMFIGLELVEYFQRTNDKLFLEQSKDGVDFLVFTLQQYANKFRVLENLPEIIYVDGASACKDAYNRPISTGTNACYAFMLRELGTLYGRRDWLDDAEKIEAVLAKVFAFEDAGERTHFIPDSFRMDDSGLVTVNDIHSEGGQYMCLWLGKIERGKLPHFYRHIFDHLGSLPSAKLNDDFIHTLRAELLVGMMVRFELLQRHGEWEKLQAELKHLYLHMIDTGPGSLWEGWSRHSNLSHGYQSYAGAIIIQAFLGLQIPNAVTKSVHIAPHPMNLKWAKGFTRVDAGGAVAVEWHRDQDCFELYVEIPDGYRVLIDVPREFWGWTLKLDHKKIAPGITQFERDKSFVLCAFR